MARGAGAQDIELARGHKQRILAALPIIQAFIQTPFAHTEYGNDNFPRAGLADNFFQHDSAISQQRAARGRNRGNRHQRIGIYPLNQRRKIHGIARGNGVAMHDMERIIALAHMQLGQSAPCAADRIKCAVMEMLQGRGFVKRIAHNFDRRLGGAFGAIVQGKSAKWQRNPLPQLCALDINQFQRSAAKVRHDAIGLVHAGNDAQSR